MKSEPRLFVWEGVASDVTLGSYDFVVLAHTADEARGKLAEYFGHDTGKFDEGPKVFEKFVALSRTKMPIGE